MKLVQLTLIGTAISVGCLLAFVFVSKSPLGFLVFPGLAKNVDPLELFFPWLAEGFDPIEWVLGLPVSILMAISWYLVAAIMANLAMSRRRLAS